MPRHPLVCSVLLGFALLTLAGGLPNTSRAQTAPHDAVATQPTGESLYEEGTKLLTRGRNFERAITVLSQAVKQESENSDYVLALGCAYASRASVLSRAIEASRTYAADTEHYKAAKSKWTAAQKDPKNPAYGYAKPEPPAPPRTQDDNRLFKIAIFEAETQVRKLSLDAWQTVDKAVVLREKDTPERRAEARNTQGWCRILLYLDARYTVKASWPPEQTAKNSGDGAQKTPAELAQMREAIAKTLFTPLQEAADLQPNNVSYLRSLGDAYVTMGTHEHSKNPIYRTKGTNILTKALEKSPDDALLRLRISGLRGLRSLLGGNTSGPQLAVDVMKQVVQSDKNNAYLWYSLFAVAGDAHDYDTAMDALQKAGGASSFRMARYSVAAPKTLAWAFAAVSIDPHWQLVQALHFVNGHIYADKSSLTADAPKFEHGVLVMAHRFKTAMASAELTPEERVKIEKNLFWAAYYTTYDTHPLKDRFPQTPEDKQLYAEAQNYIAKNDADLSAEKAMGLRP